MALSAEDMANPLRSTGLSKGELLMRETIQNSVDERRSSDGAVRFVVSRISLEGVAKRNVVERLRLREIRNRARYFPEDHGWFRDAEECIRNLEDPDVALPILSLADYGTNGLGGEWNRGMSRENRFHNLVLSIGNSSKLMTDDGLLGSHGLGKMVYALASNLRTVAYYSTFQPDSTSDDHHARFLATGFFPKHRTEEETEFTGHAFLGKPSEDDEYPTAPLVDEDAHQFVESLGFPVRSRDETGLTVFLLDCPLTVDELRIACERYWWPRLIDDRSPDYVSLEFVDQGTTASRIRPATNPRLRPFVNCYRNLRDGHVLPGYETVKLPKRGMTGGNLCLQGQRADAHGERDDLTNVVALVRRGFVVKYERDYAKEGCPDAIGVFHVAEDNERAFTYSEPPAHDEWNPNNDRLLTSMGEEYSKLIRTTLNTMRNAFRDFQTRLEERPQPKPAEDITFLDDILGPMFRRGPRTRTPPLPQTRAITIHKTARSEHHGSLVRQLLDISVGLTDATDVDERKCLVAVDLQPLVDSHGVAKGTIPRIVYRTSGEVAADAESPSVRLTLTHVRTELTAEALVHPSWRVQWVVSVRPAGGDR
jgi:hypothetical protein